MKACLNGATTMPYRLDEDVRCAAEAGFVGLEIWVAKLRSYVENRPLEELKTALDAAGLAVPALCAYGLPLEGEGRSQAIAALRRDLTTARTLGAGGLVICLGGPPAGKGRADGVREAGAILRDLAPEAWAHQVRLILEPLGNHPLVPGPLEALEVIEAAGGAPSLALLVDTFHLFKSGVPPAALRQVPCERLALVHVNDCAADRAIATDKHRLYLGEGKLPLPETMAALRSIGFNGYLSVEIFNDAYWQRPAAEIGRQAIAGLQPLLAA